MINAGVEYLVRRLKLAKGNPVQNDWGRAVFLIGAGCSVSAGIKAGAGVAQYCAQYLAVHYGAAPGQTPDEALDWLIKTRNVPEAEFGGSRDWGRLYSHFFQDHLSAPDRQREVINKLIDEAGEKINWAHICLGELVSQGYVHTVLTTNFDQLVLQGIIRAGLLPVVADGVEALNRVTDRPRRPQVVHLHGSMHTYELRNSKRAVEATQRDPKLRSILYNVLQHCELLVVIGYAGGEEGVMRLLIEAARHLETLNIVWVMFDKEETKLTPLARELLEIGDHKYVISGFHADLLFHDVMSGLGIGEPQWMKAPLRNLVAQSKLVAEVGPDLPDVSIVVDDYKRRMSVYAGLKSPQEDATVRSAMLRLRGEYDEVVKNVASDATPEGEPELVWLRALSGYNIAQEDDSTTDLSRVEADLRSLLPVFSGERLVQAYTTLLDVLTLTYERTREESALRRLFDTAEAAIRAIPRLDDERAWATFLLRKAQATEQMGQRNGDADVLSEALQDFKVAAEVFSDEPFDERLIDAKTGVATVSQMLGELRKEPGLIYDAVAQLREVVNAFREDSDTPESAARLRNLYQAIEQAARIDVANLRPLLREAGEIANRAIAIYKRNGLTSDAQAVQEELNGMLSSEGV